MFGEQRPEQEQEANTELYKEYDEFLSANADRLMKELGLVNRGDYENVPYVIELSR